MSTLSQFFHMFSPSESGAFFFWVLGIFFVFAVAIFLERLYVVIVKSNINSKKFMGTIYSLVRKNEIGKALELAKGLKDKALGHIVYQALLEAKDKDIVDFRSIQNAVDEASLEIIPKLNKRTPYLSTIANVATLWGLMGTLFGLIQSFEAVKNAGANASQALAGGIAVAMLTTLGGLFVAVPAMLMYSWLNNTTNGMIEEIDEHSVKLINAITGGQ
jgi:biopolymer transport protein ExbB